MCSPDDPFTMEMRLCDDNGMVSPEVIPDHPRQGFTYLDLTNHLRSLTDLFGERKPVLEPFHCTSHAHLAGEHIRCTSPAHDSWPHR